MRERKRAHMCANTHKHKHTHTHHKYTRTQIRTHAHTHTRTHTTTSRNTLQHTATHCSTLQHTAIRCNTLQYAATYCNTPQHTATHCIARFRDRAGGAHRGHARTQQSIGTRAPKLTLHHTATHCNTLQHMLQRTELLIGKDGMRELSKSHVLVVGLGGVGSFAAEFLVRGGKLCVAVCCSVLQCVAVCCSVLQENFLTRAD